MASLNNLEELFLDTDIEDEVKAFIKFLELESDPKYTSLEMLTMAKEADLAEEIQTGVARFSSSTSSHPNLYDALESLFTDFNGKADVLLSKNLGSSYDLKSPLNRRDEKEIENLWSTLLLDVRSDRQLLFKVFVNDYLNHYEYSNTKHPFKEFVALRFPTLGIYETFFSPEFCLELARFYIRISQDYLNSYKVPLILYGRVEDGDGKGIPNARLIHLYDNDASDKSGAETRTNQDGIFSFRYTKIKEIDPNASAIAKDPNGKNHTLYFLVDKIGYEIDSSNPDVNGNILTVTHSSESRDSVKSVNIIRIDCDSLLLNDALGGTMINGALATAIEAQTDANDISEVTLADIRKTNLLRLGSHGLTGATQVAQIKKIDALAIFELADPDPVRLRVAAQIYEHGTLAYQSPFEVAAVSRTKFINDHTATFEGDMDIVSGQGAYQAGLLHSSCEQLTKLVTTRSFQPTDSMTQPFVDDQGNILLPSLEDINTCGCSDCNSAVGPQAYLADLSQFVNKNITVSGSPIGSNWMLNNLHIDVFNIPASCSALEDTVCQGRLAANVLFKEVGTVDTSLEGKLKTYIQNTYKSFLQELGTSYEELQEYQLNLNEEERLAYANRLGLVLNYKVTPEDTSFNETITDLYKDLSAITLSDEKELLLKYFGLPVANDDITVEPEFKSNWVLDWKRMRLREVWRQTDLVDTDYHNLKKPIIDPDIVTVDDFRNPKTAAVIGGTDAPTHFDVWLNRRNFLDNVLSPYLDKDQGTPRVISDAIAQMEGSGIPDYTYFNAPTDVAFNSIWESGSLAALKGFNDTAEDLYTGFKLLPREKDRLVYLEGVDAASGSDLTNAERQEAIDILVKVVKRVLSDPLGTNGENVAHWVNEEINQEIDLSPTFFTNPINPIREDTSADQIGGLPLIDPELITENDLPDLVFRLAHTTNAETVLSTRRGSVSGFASLGVNETLKDKVDVAFSNTGYTFGDTPQANTFLKLRSDLDDPTLSESATTEIQDDLLLTVEDFIFLVDAVNTGYDDLSQSDIERTWSILKTSNKLHNLYPTWASQDNGSEIWELRKATLRRWRASLEERNGWLNALAEHIKKPSVDPDLIGPAYFRFPYNSANDFGHVFEVWQTRYSQRVDLYDDIANMGNFGSLLDQYIFSGTGLNLGKLKELENNGRDLASLLTRLNISYSDYDYFKKFQGILDDSQTPSAEQQEKLRFLIVKAQKERSHYAWLKKEVNPGADLDPEEDLEPITLSPDFFVDRNQDYSTFPPKRPYPLNELLVSETELNNWRRTVSGRKDEESDLINGWQASINKVDEINITSLRDALVDAADSSSISLTEKARLLGDRLLINLEDNCCSLTNLTAQSVETLQQLIWKTHTSDIQSDYPTLALVTDGFDSIWNWMGSYANWRASMFTFLYPENLLLPSLVDIKTDGFRQVLEQTQNNRSFTPDSACRVSELYRSYLSDVNSLVLKASIEATVLTANKDECTGQMDTWKKLMFIFATSYGSGKSYFSTVNATGDIVEQTGFWTQISEELIPLDAEIKGCDLYYSEERKINQIYVFYHRNVPDYKHKFFAALYDLNNNAWKDDVLEFEVTKEDIRLDSPEFSLFTTEPEGYFDLFSGLPTSQSIDAYEEYLEIIASSNSRINSVKSIRDSILDNVSTDILEMKICQNRESWESPVIAVSLNSSYTLFQNEQNVTLTFTRKLDYKGEKLLNEEEWDLWTCFMRFYLPEEHEYAIIDWTKSMHGLVTSFAYRIRPGEDPYWHGQEYYYTLQYGEGSYALEVSRSLDEPSKFTSFFRGYSASILPNAATYFPVERNEEPIGIQRDLFGYHYINSGQPPFFVSQAYTEDTEVQGALGFIGYDDDYTIVNTYPSDSSTRIPFVFQRNREEESENGIFVTLLSFTGGDLTQNIEPFRVTPLFEDIPNMKPLKGISDLDALKTSSREEYQRHSGLNNGKLIKTVEEAYYLVPLAIANRLYENSYYEEALDYYRLIYNPYDSINNRKVYYGLIVEGAIESNLERQSEWYKDPFNPHAIAKTRQNASTRGIIIAIAKCLYAQANAEFTFDNSESVPRARELYEDVNDLLSILKPSDPCAREEKIVALEDLVDPEAEWELVWSGLFDDLSNMETTSSEFSDLVDDIQSEIQGSQDTDVKIKNIRGLMDGVSSGGEETIGEKLVKYNSRLMDMQGAMLVADGESYFRQGGVEGRNAMNQAVTSVTGFKRSDLELPTTNMDWLKNDGSGLQDTEYAEERKSGPMTSTKKSKTMDYTKENPVKVLDATNPFEQIRLSGVSLLFCSLPNPIVTGLRMAAETNLFKINNCMNISGMVRELSPFAAPTDGSSGIPSIGVGGTVSLGNQISVPPSNFRYQFLLDRSKQLASYAQQMESSFLQYLERFDSETFSQLKAEQDIESAKGNIKLQDLKVTEANSNLELAELQKERADIQVEGLDDMIDSGLLESENRLIELYNVQLALQVILDGLLLATDITLAANDASTAHPVGAAVAATTLGAYVVSRSAQTATRLGLNVVSRDVQVSTIMASFERRKQEWEFQKSIANQDVKIGNQQIKIANDRIRIAGQEREIADLQLEHAEATLDFLKNKFTNAELYEWMSGVLEDVYSYFLQEATAMASLAEQQLSFERQINLPSLIKSDYWSVNSNGLLALTSAGEDQDRRGLTGSARLINDITRLDQYAFNATQRKQEIVKVISLNEYDPVQMEIFRNTGVYEFNLTEDHFDRDFPGQYLRTIKRISVTVIALVPPQSGIKATLFNSGISNVVTGDVVFQSRTIARNPEQISLSTSYNDYGVFNLQTEDNQYQPFEGTGVETTWKFTLEKAANRFDFRSIADVLVSVEYTSLHSPTYEKVVKTRLNSLDPPKAMALSLKSDLPDTWYELLNSEGEFTSEFEIRDTDIVPHGTNPTISMTRIFMSHEIDPGTSSLDDSTLTLTKLNGSAPQDILSMDLGSFIVNPGTAYMNAVSFNGLSPVSKWQVVLSNTNQVRQLIEEDKLNDILIIFTYNTDIVEYTV